MFLKTLTKPNVVGVVNPSKYNTILLYNSELYIINVMRETKHLGKHANKLVQEAKEKALFRTQRKAVEAGAHGTLDYTIKEGVNKNKIADEKILKSKKK